MNTTFNIGFFTYGENLDLISGGHITVEDEYIVEIGRGYVSESNTIDLRSTIAIPGIINAHIHTGDSAFKDVGFGLSLRELVSYPNGLKHKLLKSTSRRQLIKAISKTLLFLASTGTTIFCDFREGGVEGVRILRKAMKNSIVKPVILGRPSRGIHEVNDLINCSDGFGISSVFNYSVNDLKFIRELAKKHGKIIAAHVLEEMNDENEFKLALKHLEPDILVHMIYASRNNILEAKERKISIVICPRANASFGIGTPPLNLMLNENINIALGTDNVAWNSPNMFREMEYVYKHYRAMLKNTSFPKAEEILKMVTVNAAKALRISDKYGSIEEGKKANIVFIGLNDPNMVKSRNIMLSIIHRCEAENIKLTLVDGKIAYYNKQILKKISSIKDV
ncbi:MAG: amidohydrolase family protein [Candidatus Methanomethylicia archaeon]